MLDAALVASVPSIPTLLKSSTMLAKTIERTPNTFGAPDRSCGCDAASSGGGPVKSAFGG